MSAGRTIVGGISSRARSFALPLVLATTMLWVFGAGVAALSVTGTQSGREQTTQQKPQATEKQTSTPEEDLNALRQKAEQGDAEAQVNLGFTYYNGQGVPQDYIEAHRWLNLAAGNASGELGVLLWPLPSGSDTFPGSVLAPQTQAVPQRPAGSGAAAGAATLDDVLARVTTYLTDYVRDFSAVVAEERYQQQLHYEGGGGPWERSYKPGGPVISVPLDLKRELRSDYLLVRPPGEDGWIPFRDVFEVDGRPVRDRQERLSKLFLDSPAAALTDARRIADESARYNVGELERSINTPTLALQLVEPEKRSRLTLRKRGEELVEGVQTWRIDYSETKHPTVVRQPTGEDVPLSGTFWIDPQSGRIIKTLVTVSVTSRVREYGRVRADGRVTVVYRPNDALGIWVPAEMKEYHQFPGRTITCTATYSNFRRFQVTTEETITLPKPPEEMPDVR